MYKKGPSKQDRAVMQMLGLTEADYEAENVVEVCPDNWDAVLLFDDIGTQWRAGPGGIFGLDYNVLYRELDRMHLSAERYAELKDEIKVLEGAAVEEMRKE